MTEQIKDLERQIDYEISNLCTIIRQSISNDYQENSEALKINRSYEEQVYFIKGMQNSLSIIK